MLFDLAEALGCTVGELETRITDREVIEWCVRSRTMPLWPRRLEVMLAQVARCSLGQAAGTTSLREFILFRDPDDLEANTAEENGNVLAGIAGGGLTVRKLGQGRKSARRDH